MPAPVIAAGISAGASLFGNRKTAAEKAMEGTARQQGALASQIAQMARQQHTMSGPALNKAMQHYMTLAGGNRAAIQSALAPDMNMLMDSYKGAEMGINRSAAGPQRDRQIAELYRQKAGQMGMMPMQARQGAMNQLGSMGMDLSRSAGNLMGMGGNILAGQAGTQSMLGGMQQQRNQGWASLGNTIGNIFMPYIMAKFPGPGGVKLPPGPSNDVLLGPRP